jgi:hypothetical protein
VLEGRGGRKDRCEERKGRGIRVGRREKGQECEERRVKKQKKEE